MQNPYQQPGANHPYGYQPPPIPNHSGLGIASFVIAALCALTSIVVIASFISKMRTVSSEDSYTDAIFDVALLGLTVIGILFLALIGLILGIVALTQPHRQRALSTIGTFLNGLIILGFLALMFTGMTR